MSTTVEFKFDIGDRLVWMDYHTKKLRSGEVYGFGYASDGIFYNVGFERVIEADIRDYVENRRF